MPDIYLKFANPLLHCSLEDVPLLKVFKEAIGRTLNLIHHHSNPDFVKAIHHVSYWCVEFDEVYKFPLREIGFDQNNYPLVAMPWGENYGYWTDYEMTVDDFKTAFKVSIIDYETFNECWKKFENLNNNNAPLNLSQQQF